MARTIIAAWILVTLFTLVFVWRSWELKESFEPNHTSITLCIADESAIMVEVPAEGASSNLLLLQVSVTCILIALSALIGNAVRLLYHRDLMRWLEGPVRVSILGGYLLLGAGCISLSGNYFPDSLRLHFFVWLFGFLLFYALVVLYLAAWRDAVESKSGAFALLSRIGIEALAWLTGGIGLFTVLFAVGIKFVAIFVR